MQLSEKRHRNNKAKNYIIRPLKSERRALIDGKMLRYFLDM